MDYFMSHDSCQNGRFQQGEDEKALAALDYENFDLILLRTPLK